MKTLKIFLLFALCLTLQQLSAQFSVGIKGGYVNAWEYYGDVELPEDAQIDVNGYNISALAYLRLNNNLKVGMEPGFVQRGAACVPGWMPIFEGDTEFELNYIEAPVFISGNLQLFKSRFEVFGKLGYGASYLTSAYREELTSGIGGSDSPVIRTKMDLGEDSILNRLDHGAYGNFGFAYNLGIHQIFIESGYYHSFTDAERFNTSKNRSVNLNIGYMISL